MRFLVVGGLATLLHYAILVVLVSTSVLSPKIASMVGFLVSAGFNYSMNYYWSFRSNQSHRKAVVRFLWISMIGLGLNAALMGFGMEVVQLHYLAAQCLATAGVVVWSFMANRRWTFV